MVFETKFYDLLEVEPNATDDELKRAFKKMAEKYHSDENASKTDQMKDIPAFLTLVDEENGLERGDFDEEGYELTELGDVDGVRQILCKMDVSLEELYTGSSKIVKLKTYLKCGKCTEQNDSCETCNGKETLNDVVKVCVKIPVGMDKNLRMSYTINSPRSQPIKLIVIINELEHPTFTRSGHNLNTEVTLDMKDALTFGGKVIKSLDGRMLNLKNENYNSVFKAMEIIVVPREGMPYFRRADKKGALYVTFKLINIESCTIDAKEVELTAVPYAEKQGICKQFPKK